MYCLCCETEGNGITCIQNMENRDSIFLLLDYYYDGIYSIEENPETYPHHNDS